MTNYLLLGSWSYNVVTVLRQSRFMVYRNYRFSVFNRKSAISGSGLLLYLFQFQIIFEYLIKF